MKEIKLSNSDKVALVDDDLFDVLSKRKWSLNNFGYVMHQFGPGHCLLLHRRVLELTDKSLRIDHINRNPLDNRRCNLRICSISQNRMNVARLERNTSGYKGVSWMKSRGKYRARIWLDKVELHLGMFESKIEAAIAYDDKAIELYGEFAVLNFQLFGA